MSAGREQIALCIKSLSLEVQAICQRYDKHREVRPHLPEVSEAKRKRLKRILLHLQHALFQSAHKDQVLLAGLECLAQRVWPEIFRALTKKQISSSSTIDATAPLLQHIFEQLIRLHDGHMMLISGECRHSGDIARAKSSRFPSLLTKRAQRADGYTTLYSSDRVYSGFSWDEIMDEHNGIRTRLVKELSSLLPPGRRDCVWDDLSERVPTLEMLLSDMERRSGERKCTLNNLAHRIITELQHCWRAEGRCQVDLNLTDKMERFIIRANGTTLQWTRRGHEFNLPDALGTLPETCATVHAWYSVMCLSESAALDKENNPARPFGKAAPIRQRAICDSSDEDGDNIQNEDTAAVASEQKTTTGLHVQLRKIVPLPAPAVESVNQVKEQLGVDSEHLALAREALELENQATTEEAERIDRMDLAELDECMEQLNLEQAERHVRRLRKALAASMRSLTADEYQIWDERECLREALMTAGNGLLWNVAADHDALQERLDQLTRAGAYFTEARNRVHEQESLLDRLCRNTDWRDDVLFYQQNLVLLQCQARVNVGIAGIEQAKLETKLKQRYSLKAALSELDQAVVAVRKLASRLSNDDSQINEMLRAQQLQVLALRWCGVGMLRLGRLDNATTILASAWETFSTISTDVATNILHSEYVLEVLVECYNCATVLAAESTLDLETITVSEIKQAPEVGSRYLAAVCLGLDESVKISEKVKLHFAMHGGDTQCSQYMGTHGVHNATELQKAKQEIQDWWTRRRDISLASLGSKQQRAGSSSFVSAQTDDADFDTSVIHYDANDELPPSLAVVNNNGEIPRRGRGRAQRTAAYSNIQFSQTVPPPPQSVASSAQSIPRRYRRWGDGLLPQTTDESGRTVPQYKYPTLPPEMPPEIRAIVDRKTREAAERS